MQRRVFAWRRALAFAPLGLMVAWTLWRQAHWDVPSFWWLFNPISWGWMVLLGGWVWRLSDHFVHGEHWPRRLLILPLCIGALVGLQLFDLPLRLLFWTHQKALTRALKRAPLERQLHSQAPHIGLFRPLQISKSKGATRLILWENPDLLSGTAVGFAHCPRGDGCSSASFSRFYEDSEGEPQTLRLSDEWIAVSVYGSDF